MNMVTYGSGEKDDPWVLKTPPQSSEFEAWRERSAQVPALIIQVGKTRLSYHLRGIEDAHAMLLAHGDWMLLGNADEGKATREETLEHWARAAENPLGGYYGLRKGYRGRFANYVSPVMELLGLVELEHNARNNRLRALG
ncbi:MAG: hypothetical protein JKX69_11455 [Rhodobacteraceae bacterium]|nr:hypothetical protein [Paracoccaceae bacterium]PHR62303.1 MAG: hypothetical protein COA47_04845 [Robiginitomaculum sp.]